MLPSRYASNILDTNSFEGIIPTRQIKWKNDGTRIPSFEGKAAVVDAVDIGSHIELQITNTVQIRRINFAIAIKDWLEPKELYQSSTGLVVMLTLIRILEQMHPETYYGYVPYMLAVPWRASGVPSHDSRVELNWLNAFRWLSSFEKLLHAGCFRPEKIMEPTSKLQILKNFEDLKAYSSKIGLQDLRSKIAHISVKFSSQI